MDSSSQKYAQPITNSFEKIPITSKRKPNLIESDRGKGFNNIIFQNFLNNNNIEQNSRNSSSGAFFAEKCNVTIRKLLKRPVFLKKKDGNWIDILPTIKKQYINRVHSCTKLTTIQASLKRNGGYVY